MQTCHAEFNPNHSCDLTHGQSLKLHHAFTLQTEFILLNVNASRGGPPRYRGQLVAIVFINTATAILKWSGEASAGGM